MSQTIGLPVLQPRNEWTGLSEKIPLDTWRIFLPLNG